VAEQPTCPHCDAALEPFKLPDEGGWDSDFHVACFNDECPYYVKGWQWMQERYGVKSSYRYRLDPATGKASPIAVWSPTALRDRIMDADLSVDPAED
jgi:hypothetical protein